MLSRVGGSTVKEAVRNCLYHILDKEIAVKFSYFGQKGKNSFSKLEIKKVLCDAILCSNSCSGADEHTIKAVVMSWLKHSTDHRGGRKERLIKQATAAVQPTPAIQRVEESSSESISEVPDNSDSD